MKNKIYIFDTTLRDGEQVPGASLNTVEKVEIAKQLEKLGVDIIEAGFPISSPGDFESVRRVSKVIKQSCVCALSRAVAKDIDAAHEAIQNAKHPRIHTFIGTSDIHIKNIMRTSKEDVLHRAVAAVRLAKKYQKDVEFSAMDAGRTDLSYLSKVVQEVIKAGATIINVPDTTGYMFPEEYKKMILYLFHHVDGIKRVIVSTHNHNDLGLASATTLAGIEAGCRQVEVTINGIGERAGNAALEEIVMAIKTRSQKKYHIDINTKQIYKTSKMVSSMMEIPVQPNKAIIGRNAFAHSSGIHQDGIIKKRETFEIIDPKDIGLARSAIILTARSGRSALRDRLKKLGFRVSKKNIDPIYEKFLVLADKKKEIFDRDLEELMERKRKEKQACFKLELVQVICGNKNVPTATVKIFHHGRKKIFQETTTGTGPVDAVFRAVDQIIRKHIHLKEFLVQAVTEGIDAQGKVNVEIAYKGKNYYGEGADTDIIIASTIAYIDAINQIH